MARPPKITPEVVKTILTSLRIGNYRETAAADAGISPRTLRSWLNKGGSAKSGEYFDFHRAVLKAEAAAEGQAVQTVRKAMRNGDWKAAESFLERKFPKRWGRQINVTLGEELTKLLDVAERVLDSPSFGRLLDALTDSRGDDEAEG